MTDDHVQEFFEMDVGYEQQLGSGGECSVHSYDVNSVLKCSSAAKRRQWRLQVKVKETRQRLMVLRNKVAHMERYLHKLENEEDCQGIIVDIMSSLCIKDDTASVSSDAMKDDDKPPHKVVKCDVIDLSHEDDSSNE